MTGQFVVHRPTKLYHPFDLSIVKFITLRLLYKKVLTWTGERIAVSRETQYFVTVMP